MMVEGIRMWLWAVEELDGFSQLRIKVRAALRTDQRGVSVCSIAWAYYRLALSLLKGEWTMVKTKNLAVQEERPEIWNSYK